MKHFIFTAGIAMYAFCAGAFVYIGEPIFGIVCLLVAIVLLLLERKV